MLMAVDKSFVPTSLGKSTEATCNRKNGQTRIPLCIKSANVTWQLMRASESSEKSAAAIQTKTKIEQNVMFSLCRWQVKSAIATCADASRGMIVAWLLGEIYYRQLN